MMKYWWLCFICSSVNFSFTVLGIYNLDIKILIKLVLIFCNTLIKKFFFKLKIYKAYKVTGSFIFKVILASFY